MNFKTIIIKKVNKKALIKNIHTKLRDEDHVLKARRGVIEITGIGIDQK
jgi:tRNA A22 N-methylase